MPLSENNPSQPCSHVGLIGLGIMGRALAANLEDDGQLEPNAFTVGATCM